VRDLFGSGLYGEVSTTVAFSSSLFTDFLWFFSFVQNVPCSFSFLFFSFFFFSSGFCDFPLTPLPRYTGKTLNGTSKKLVTRSVCARSGCRTRNISTRSRRSRMLWRVSLPSYFFFSLTHSRTPSRRTAQARRPQGDLRPGDDGGARGRRGERVQ
jgi:hypothetical protein